MNEHSHSFRRRWALGLQLSFLFAFVTQSLMCAVAQASSGEVLVQPVAAYSFDEGSGTTVIDASGNGNTGVIAGASWITPGKLGSALNLNGTGWVTVNDSNSLDLTTGMTLEAWVYPTVTPLTWTTVILKEQPEVSNLVYGLFAGSPFNLPLADVFTTSVQELYGPAPVPLNTWTHLAATYDAVNGQSLYLNGIQVVHVATSGSMITSVGPLRLGGNSIWGEYFTGLIDEVRVYNQALSQTDIQADMNTPIGPCVRGPGYWMNHAEAWCMPTIQIGCVTYTRAEAIAIMRHNSSQDKTYTLAQQLIATKLSIACKNTSNCISGAVVAADSWFCAHPVGSGVKASSSAWQQIQATHNLLANYNAGQLCSPSCDAGL